MKSFVRNILFIAVALLYIVSTMGYGVHKCASDGTASLILLFGETPCEWVHSHIDDEGNCYTHAHNPAEHHGCCHHGEEQEHDDDCCSTSVYVLTHDQTTQEDVQILVPSFFLIDSLFYGVGQHDLFAVTLPGAAWGTVFKEPLPQDVQQALLCTFRV